jgi:hypothetical protein
VSRGRYAMVSRKSGDNPATHHRTQEISSGGEGQACQSSPCATIEVLTCLRASERRPLSGDHRVPSWEIKSAGTSLGQENGCYFIYIM